MWRHSLISLAELGLTFHRGGMNVNFLIEFMALVRERLASSYSVTKTNESKIAVYKNNRINANDYYSNTGKLMAEIEIERIPIRLLRSGKGPYFYIVRIESTDPVLGNHLVEAVLKKDDFVYVMKNRIVVAGNGIVSTLLKACDSKGLELERVVLSNRSQFILALKGLDDTTLVCLYADKLDGREVVVFNEKIHCVVKGIGAVEAKHPHYECATLIEIEELLATIESSYLLQQKLLNFCRNLAIKKLGSQHISNMINGFDVDDMISIKVNVSQTDSEGFVQIYRRQSHEVHPDLVMTMEGMKLEDFPLKENDITKWLLESLREQRYRLRLNAHEVIRYGKAGHPSVHVVK